MKPGDFLKCVTENRLLPVNLFLGEERLFHVELLQAAREKLLTPDEQDFNYMQISAAGVEPGDLLRNLETPPFFGDVRLIYLDDLESCASGVEEAILGGIGNMATGVYLLISAAKLDGRKKVHQELQKRITVVDCSRLRPNDLPAWVKSRAEKYGLVLTPAQIGKVVQRVGSELVAVDTQLQKAATFAGKPGKLRDIDLDDLIPGEPEPDIFALIDAVAARNPRQGLPRLEELLNAGENELKILATLSRQFRNIAAAWEARRQGMNSKTLAGVLGINPYVAEKSFTQSGNFTLEELQWIMERLLTADYRMKTGQQESRLEIELAVVEICGVR